MRQSSFRRAWYQLLGEQLLVVERPVERVPTAIDLGNHALAVAVQRVHYPEVAILPVPTRRE